MLQVVSKMGKVVRLWDKCVKLHVFIELDRAAVIKKAEPTWRQEYLIFGRPHPNEGDVVHWVQIPVGRHHNECLTSWKFL